MTPQLNLLFDATEGLAHADPTIVPGNNLIVCNMRNADSWSAVTTVNTHVSREDIILSDGGLLAHGDQGKVRQ